MKIKKRSINVVSLQDFDELVEKTYGRPYSLQQQDGCIDRQLLEFTVPSEDDAEDYENDSVDEVINGNEMGVSFAAWLARDPKQKLKEGDPDHILDLFWSRSFYPEFYTVVNDLHAKGLLEAGDYGIDIDW